MIVWDDYDRVSAYPRRPRLDRRKVRRIAVTTPIPSLAAITADIGCTYCNAAPGDPCYGPLTYHMERQDAAADLRDRMLGR